jgi:actin-related protein
VFVLPWYLYQDQQCLAQLAQIAFASGIYALYPVPHFSCAVLGSGMPSAFVLDVGFSESSACIVSEGHVLHNTVARSSVGAHSLNQYIAMLNQPISTSTNALPEGYEEQVEELKRCWMRLSKDSISLAPPAATSDLKGSPLATGMQRTFFQQNSRSKDGNQGDNNLASLLLKVRRNADGELRGPLPVLCIGGTSADPTFLSLLQSELKKVDASFYKVIPQAAAEESGWLGAALLSQSSEFNRLWISAKEFQNQGMAALQAKLF